jgi:hypothetical protein
MNNGISIKKLNVTHDKYNGYILICIVRECTITTRPFGIINWQTEPLYYATKNKKYLDLLYSEDVTVQKMIFEVIKNNQNKEKTIKSQTYKLVK